MLKPGDDAPDFELTDQEGKEWRSKDLRGQKVILYFYPADDTPGCTKEACDFRDSQSYWKDAGYVVLGVSPQNAASKRRFTDKYSLNFPLLADEGNEVAKAYGSLKEDPSEWQGIKLHVKRSTFVIDENGKIDQALYGVHAKNHVADLRETLSV